jgi:hypothetical protein
MQPATNDEDTQVIANPPWPDEPGRKPFFKEKTHTRAGFTTNKGHGQSKARRKMAAESRRRNRK